MTLALFSTFALAKGLALYGKNLDFSMAMVPQLLWQDALVSVVFGLLFYVLKKTRMAVYFFLVFFAALNVPVQRVLSSPITINLLRATGGALSDSILLYATWQNMMAFFAVLGSGFFFLRLYERKMFRILGSSLMTLVFLLGFLGNQELFGFSRNPVWTFIGSLSPRVQSTVGVVSRVSPFGTKNSEDLTSLRGIARGKNILLIGLESTGAQYLKSFGAKEDPMPHFTQWAQEGILFENAYAVYPESIKGLFSVLCATAPAMDTKAQRYDKVHIASLPGALKKSGYRTALFHSGRFMYLGMEAIVKNRGFDLLEDAGDISGEKFSSFGITDESITVKRILKWINTIPINEKFFVHYLPIAGHHPYVTPNQGPFDPKEEINRYRNALYHADESIALLVERLKKRNLLVVLYGDHGEAFFQHTGNYGHTLYIYEENIHVPLLFLLPLEKRLRVKRAVSLMDITPTVLDLVGITPSEKYQGQSLLYPESRMTFFLTDYSLGLLGLRDANWKFIYGLEEKKGRLFDLDADPRERNDRSEAFRNRAEQYKRTLLLWSQIQRGNIYKAGSD